MKSLVVFLSFIVFWGCAARPPLEDYTLAKSALDGAMSSGASKFAPNFWFKAEENYRKGEQAFKSGLFEESKSYFILSKDYSEKAENKARLYKSKSGEDF